MLCHCRRMAVFGDILMAFWQQAFSRFRILFLVLAAVGLFLLIAGRAILFSYLEAGFTAYLAKEHNLSVTVDAIGGSVVGDIHVAGIKGVRKDDGGGVAEFSIDSLRAEYSIFDLLGGMESFLAGSTITLRQGSVVLDLDGGDDSASESEFGISLPSVLPRLDADGLAITLRRKEGSIALAGGSLSVGLSGRDAGQTIRMASSEITIVRPGKESLQAAGRMTFLYRPEYLQLTGVFLDEKEIPASGHFDFSRQGGPYDFAFDLKGLGGEVAISGNLAPAVQEFSLRLQDIDLSKVEGVFPVVKQALSGTASAHADVKMTPAGVSASLKSELAGHFSGKAFSLNVTASLAQGELIVERLRGALGGNSIELAQLAAPVSALADWKNIPAGGARVERFSVKIADIASLWEFAGKPPAVIAGLPPSVLELSGSLREQRLVFDRSEFKSRRNSLLLSEGAIRLPAEGESFFDQEISGNLLVSLTDLHELSVLLAIQEMAGSLHGTINLSGTLAAPSGLVKVAGEGLRYQGCKLGEIALEAMADGKEIRVKDATIRQGGDRLRFSGRYSHLRKKIDTIEGELRIRDLASYAGTCKMLGADISGGLQASITTAAGEGQNLSLHLRNGHWGPVAISTADVSIATADWRSFTLDKSVLQSQAGSLSLAGVIVSDPVARTVTARMQQLVFSRGGSKFAAEKPFVVIAGYGAGRSLQVDSMLLRGASGSVAASGRISAQDEGAIQVKVSGLDSGDWLAGFLAPGYSFKGLDANFGIRGPLPRVRASLAGTVAALASPHFDAPLAGTIDLVASAEGVRLNKFSWLNSHGQQISLVGLIPYDPFAENKFLAGRFSVDGTVRLPDLDGIVRDKPGKEAVSGEVFGELRLRGSWDRPDGQLTIRAKNLAAPWTKAYLPSEPVAVDSILSFSAGRLVLKRCKLDAASFSGRLSGEWGGLPPLVTLLREPQDGLPGFVDLNGALRMADLGWLAGRSKSLRRVSGQIETEFSLHGKAAQPKLTGSFVLKNGGLRFAAVNFPSMDGLNGQAEFAGESIHIRGLRGLLGGAPFSIDGVVDLAGEEARIDCVAKGSNLLFVRDADLKIRGDADLRLQGPVAGMVLSGDLVVTDGRYTKNFDFLRLFKGTARPRSDSGLQLFSLPDPPFRDMVFHLKISAAEPFLIKNNLASGSVRPVLRLSGSGEVPVLTGRVFVDPSRISLPAGRLAVESGVVTFSENDPGRPTLDLFAKSRLAGYDISMRFQGTSEEPVITLSSVPPLSDEDLLLLVLTGRPPLDPKGSNRRQVAGMNLAVYLGKGLLANLFGNGGAETDESVLERFDLDIGRQITRSGEDTVEAQFRMVEGLLLPGDRLLITSEKDVYDNYNVGVKIVFRFQ